MVRKKMAFAVICATILILSGCGSNSTSVPKDTSVGESLLENTDSFQQDKTESSRKSEEGNSDNSSDKKESGEPLDTSQEEQVDTGESMAVNPAEPLSMEDDDVSFEEIVGLINASVIDARTKLEIEDDSNEKTSMVFGETVNITLKENEDILSGIQLSFLGTPIDSLQIAIAEQLGDDGELVNDGILWQIDEAFVLLYESAEGCYVDIGIE